MPYFCTESSPMKILIVAATWPEIAPLEKRLTFVQENGDVKIYRLGNAEIHTLCTGVGMTATAVSASSIFAKTRYDRAINAGICGCFVQSVPLGDVVVVEKDRIPELGAENGEEFLSVHELDLHGESQFPYEKGWILGSSESFPEFASLRRVHGITVNTAHGNDKSIERVIRSFNPEVESMEGAAFLMSALYASVPAIQLRAVSNYMERRDKSKWNIPLALTNLNQVLYDGLEKMSK